MEALCIVKVQADLILRNWVYMPSSTLTGLANVGIITHSLGTKPLAFAPPSSLGGATQRDSKVRRMVWVSKESAAYPAILLVSSAIFKFL